MTAGEVTDEGELLVAKDGPVLRLVLSNPRKRNALTWPMYDALEGVRARVDADPDLRVVVLRGAGGRAFAAGTDISQFPSFTSGQDGLAYERRVGRVLESLLAVRVPVVAVVDGPAVGAGLALVACCDVVVATPEAVFGAPIARTLGNCLPVWVVARLRERLGASRAMALLLTSQLMPAHEAAAAGLVTELVARHQLDGHVETLVQGIAGAAPLTLASLKEMDRRLSAAALATDADDLLLRCYGSRDFREGVSAFLEHRAPRWEGR